MTRFHGKRISCALFAISLGPLLYPGTSVADPAKYPQFAQQQLPKGVALDFISLDQLVGEIVNVKKPIIVDVRSLEEYEEAHIKAAISIPLGEIPLRLAEIPKNKPVVLYWACPHHLASLAYGILYQEGYRNMKVLYEGFPGWIEKGYPLEGSRAR